MMRDVLVMDCDGCKDFWLTLKSSHKFYFAATAAEGLSMLSENIGLVFLNLRLSDMSGLEALQLIKSDYPSTPVIIISSSGTEETCLEAFRKGARDYIRKPLRSDEILQKITLLISTSQVSQRRQHVFLPSESARNEDHPDIPPHLVGGVLRVRDFIAYNHSESLTLSAACRMASISRTYFCRFFKCITGHSLRSFHHAVKVGIAEELLQDKRLSITDVAMRLGYDDPNYFSTVYKKITGVSPRERQSSYQEAHRVEEQQGEGGAHPVPGFSPQPVRPQEDLTILREWHASYTALYREREEPRPFSSRRQTSGVMPKYKKVAARGLATIRKLNRELDMSLEYIEP